MTGAGAGNGPPAVKSANRVFDLLGAIGESPEGTTFTGVLRRLGLPKSSLHALLDVLVRREYIEFDPDARIYTLGVKVLENSQAYLKQHPLIGEARKVMERICGEMNETVQLAKLDGVENVYLAKADSTHLLRLQSDVGGRLPAHATGLGKVLLAYLPPAELDRRYAGVALAPVTPNTFTDRRRLAAELAAIRERGFGIDNEEYTPGLFCVAVPVHHGSDKAALAMSISVPMLRISLDRAVTALSLLAGGSLEITKRIGGTFVDPVLTTLVDSKAAQRAFAVMAKEGRYRLPFTPAAGRR